MAKCLECEIPEVELGGNINKHHMATGHTKYNDEKGSFFYPVSERPLEAMSADETALQLLQEQLDKQCDLADRALKQCDEAEERTRSVRRASDETIQAQVQKISSQNLQIADLELQLKALKDVPPST